MSKHLLNVVIPIEIDGLPDLEGVADNLADAVAHQFGHYEAGRNPFYVEVIEEGLCKLVEHSVHAAVRTHFAGLPEHDTLRVNSMGQLVTRAAFEAEVLLATREITAHVITDGTAVAAVVVPQ